jgi:hypothetical protein
VDERIGPDRLPVSGQPDVGIVLNRPTMRDEIAANPARRVDSAHAHAGVDESCGWPIPANAGRGLVRARAAVTAVLRPIPLV